MKKKSIKQEVSFLVNCEDYVERVNGEELIFYIWGGMKNHFSRQSSPFIGTTWNQIFGVA
jgi:hypothetical protein